MYFYGLDCRKSCIFTCLVNLV